MHKNGRTHFGILIQNHIKYGKYACLFSPSIGDEEKVMKDGIYKTDIALYNCNLNFEVSLLIFSVKLKIYRF